MINSGVNKSERNEKKDAAGDAQFGHLTGKVSGDLFRNEEPDNPFNKHNNTYSDKNQPHMIKNKHINRVHNSSSSFILLQLVRKVKRGKFFLLIILIALSASGVAVAKEDLQQGYALFQKGRYADASSYFREAAKNHPLLSCYALFYLAVSYQRLGEEESALKTYSRFLALHPQHRLAPVVLFRVAGLRSKSSRHTEAITAYHRLIKNPSFFTQDRLYFLLATEYLSLGERTKALLFYRKVISNFPRSEWAIASLEKSREIEVKLATRPTAMERYENARVLKHHRQYEPALAILTEISQKEITLKLAADVQMFIGDIYSRLRKHNQAIEAYKKFLSRFPHSDLRPRAIYMIAGEFYVLGNSEMTFKNYGQLIATYPSHPLADDSLKRQGELLEEKGKLSLAISKYKRILTRYPDGGLGDEVSHRIARYYFMEKEDFSQAANFFAFIFHNYPDSPLAPEAMYWLGRSQEKIGDHLKAIETYQLLMGFFPRHFYRFQAMQRIDRLNYKLLEKTTIDNYISFPVSGEMKMFSQMTLRDDANINFRKGVALIRAEMYEDAIGEILFSPINRDQEFFFNLAALYAEIEDYRRSIMQIEIASKRWDVLYKELLFYLYPRYFREHVERSAQEFGVDPFLIWAIIHVESKFNPQAVSRSDARGLMQFIPSTGRWVAKKLNIEFSPFNPAVNIRMGAWYINHLIRAFDGNVVFAIAAYNGGQGNVRRWIARGGFSDMDEFIEMIPRDETRTFVKRVLGNYNMYRWLYRRH
jgi:soluble lytic murein transglycosylase